MTGKAECKLAETGFTGLESYLISKTYLFGFENGEAVDVPAGVYSYGFGCRLPESIPYSIEGKNGSIKFKLKAILDIPSSADFETEKFFTVVRYDDLNLIQSPIYRQPCGVQQVKTFRGLCWSSNLIMTLSVPKTGFGLGETIPIWVQINNKTFHRIHSSKFKLLKIEQCNSISPPKSTERTSVVASKTSHRAVYERQSVEYLKFLKIPENLPTSNDRFCEVYQIKYRIHYRAKIDAFVKLPSLHIDIVIGNKGVVDETACPVAVNYT